MYEVWSSVDGDDKELRGSYATMQEAEAYVERCRKRAVMVSDGDIGYEADIRGPFPA
jgi:hypothetical protein